MGRSDGRLRTLSKSTVGLVKAGILIAALAWLHFFTPAWAQGVYGYLKYFLALGFLLWLTTFTRTSRFGVLLLFSIFGAFSYFLSWAASLYLSYRGEGTTFADIVGGLAVSGALLLLPLYVFFFHSRAGRTAGLLDGFALGAFSGVGWLFVQLYQQQFAFPPILAVPPASWETAFPTIVPTLGEPAMVFYTGTVGWVALFGFAVALARRSRALTPFWPAIPLALVVFVWTESASFGLVTGGFVLPADARDERLRAHIGLTPEEVASLDAEIAKIAWPPEPTEADLKSYNASVAAAARSSLTPEKYARYDEATRPARLVTFFYRLDGSGRAGSTLFLLCFLFAAVAGEVIVSRGVARHEGLRLDGEPPAPNALSEVLLLQQAVRKSRDALTAVDRFIAARRRLAVLDFESQTKGGAKDSDHLAAAEDAARSRMAQARLCLEGVPLPPPEDGDTGVNWSKFVGGLVFTLVLAFLSMKLILLLGIFFAQTLKNVPVAYMYASAVTIALAYVANYFRLSMAEWGSSLLRKLLALFGWRTGD